MTNEQLEKLKKIQSDLKTCREAEQLLVRSKNYKVTVLKGDYNYPLPLEQVEGLREEIHAWLLDQFLGKALELENQLDELILCKETKSESVYSPINDSEL